MDCTATGEEIGGLLSVSGWLALLCHLSPSSFLRPCQPKPGSRLNLKQAWSALQSGNYSTRYRQVTTTRLTVTTFAYVHTCTLGPKVDFCSPTSRLGLKFII